MRKRHNYKKSGDHPKTVSTFFEYNELIIKSSHDDLLGLHVRAIDEAQHIYAGEGERRNNVSVLSRTE